ncbi:methylmalonyl-CoA mutase [Mucilaginibacter terrenus]|uniref:Fused isobutyryl-CoA mutase n=1 Tax=Mucilaginibacter terrenus TaxID=2482727 RepID=A0A3E2NL25_9SPHI|nr:methylmalonyl-CoA mutase family protein [Mucilaginibacter terrenus]RFZ81704.1 methylmalonyl-CoA mutase [Mucilaginibacter terrenus]
MESIPPYNPTHKIRFVTAAALFDGHDATINIMRRILQSTGAEVIHLGHNRSVEEVVTCAMQEDVQGIALTSYQGGHLEYFKYMRDLLNERGAARIKIFGGGGGVFLPDEIQELHSYGITRIYTPDDGRHMGLQGMINHMMQECDYLTPTLSAQDEANNAVSIARSITAAELGSAQPPITHNTTLSPPVLGITGTGGSGKSSLVDEFVRRYLMQTDKTLAIISVDPSKRKTGGALLGDRIRMNAINSSRVYMRSLATRQANLALSKHVQEAIDICRQAGYDMVIVETSGIGQSDTMITDYCDVSLYVMTPEFGAATQLEKIDMLDFADLVALNKFDKRGALDALRDVRKQYKRNHQLFDAKDDDLPVYGTMASQFNDPGMNTLFAAIMRKVQEKTGVSLIKENTTLFATEGESEKIYIIPPDRVRYLAEIAESSAAYTEWVNEQCRIAQQMFQVKGAMEVLEKHTPGVYQGENTTGESLQDAYTHLESHLHPDCKRLLKEWPGKVNRYKGDEFVYKVRDKEFRQSLKYTSLAGLQISKIALPKYEAWGDVLRWLLTENVPGEFPFAAGVFPLKQEGEDPTRMFAGEGGPERTNKRFHYVSMGQPAQRLSTAFDSVTLYGEDPHIRPDIYGKIGNSGVSIATLDDAKKLYSGFDLCNPSTSVSMTINGPAPMLLGFFMNAAIDQQCELYIRKNKLEHLVEAKLKGQYDDKGKQRPAYANFEETFAKIAGSAGGLQGANNGLGLMLLGITGDEVLPAEVYEKIKASAISKVRGTVQADILKEDQAQNTCIFSTEFALRMMGDMQQYFIRNKIRNFYSVSISGYHIAEAGANPITQLAFTLSNGFTYVEYYLSRGMRIDDFAPNLSFFFSNGIDPEYSVIGRVARRIWAKAIKNKYKGNERSQKLKYHIQTSGRSLHAQEIDFNDIRTTLQALYAIYDNCNSLHTNAYDEAITTPTEESVRRAMAIQLIINRELGLAKNENPIQGSFIIEELTDLVEQAVLTEFKAINDRGGVLGAMETMYQRSKIQEESLYYETLKHTGEYPIVGVNTFLNQKGSPTIIPAEVIRATEEEKQAQIKNLDAFQQRNAAKAGELLKRLQQTAIAGENIFAELMEVCKYCSLGQISHALYEVGGQYRRNM